MQQNHKIVIDLYDGNYSPTLLFRVQSQEKLSQLRDLFTKLSKAADHHREDLCEYEWISCLPSIKSLIVERLTNREAEPSKTVRLIEWIKKPAVVHWSRHEEGWLECAEKLDGLNVPGHQYLDTGHFSDASVEVSFMENTPD
jgi:hypothetical protein